MALVVVTGGAGRIGSELCRLLARAGHRVRAFDLPGSGLESLVGTAAIEAVTGDIFDLAGLRKAVGGADVVAHLAALLPPASEVDPDRTMKVNEGGTRALIQALVQEAPNARVVLASSVVAYGPPAGEQAITVNQPLRPADHYGRSKAAAEAAVRESGLEWTILRISGVAVAEVLEPPDPWPFTREQRIEFVLREDVAAAAALAVEAGDELTGRIVHVAGGPSWRMDGERYATDYLRALGLPDELARFSEKPGAFDWYEPSPELAALGFRPVAYGEYLARLGEAVRAFLADAEA